MSQKNAGNSGDNMSELGGKQGLTAQEVGQFDQVGFPPPPGELTVKQQRCHLHDSSRQEAILLGCIERRSVKANVLYTLLCCQLGRLLIARAVTDTHTTLSVLSSLLMTYFDVRSSLRQASWSVRQL